MPASLSPCTQDILKSSEHSSTLESSLGWKALDHPEFVTHVFHPTSLLATFINSGSLISRATQKMTGVFEGPEGKETPNQGRGKARRKRVWMRGERQGSSTSHFLLFQEFTSGKVNYIQVISEKFSPCFGLNKLTMNNSKLKHSIYFNPWATYFWNNL